MREFRSCCSELARNVVVTFDEEKALGFLHISLNRARDRAADALGVSKSSVQRLLRGSTGLLDPGEAEERERGMAMEGEDASAIRPALVAIIREKKPLTLDSLLQRIKEDNPPWIWSRATLHRALVNRCGIVFRKRVSSYYRKMREDPENMRRRALYLKQFFQYEREGREFIYMDESWINKNLVPSKCWTDGTTECEIDVPSGKGERWILIGAGGQMGWIHQSCVMWRGNRQKEDYHTEMNAEVFEHWLKNKLLPIIPPNSCIVLDRAPYHKMLTEESKIARSNWKKEQVAQWLVDHGATDDNGVPFTVERFLNEPAVVPDGERRTTTRKGWTKQALLVLAHEMRPKPQYMIWKWTREFNEAHETDVVPLLLPVAHPTLNPIEMLWGQIKQFVAANNGRCNMELIAELTRAKQHEQGSEAWQNSIRHSRRYAAEQWEVDEQLLQEAELEEEVSEVEENPEDSD